MVPFLQHKKKSRHGYNLFPLVDVIQVLQDFEASLAAVRESKENNSSQYPQIKKEVIRS